MNRDEIAASIIQPYFDTVRKEFCNFSSDDKIVMKKLTKVRFVVSDVVRDKERHFAATRDDGIHMIFAADIVELPQETLLAIMIHEFGHAADFAYPSRWITPTNYGKALWIDEAATGLEEFDKWKRLWRRRTRDQVEWAADSIAFAVTGQELRYCGDCVLQCFDGIRRPAGLR